MKTTVKIILNVMLISAAFLVSSCDGATQKSGQDTQKEGDVEYMCPMHPAVTQDTPGVCRICYMPLIEVKEEKEEDTTEGDMEHEMHEPGDDHDDHVH